MSYKTMLIIGNGFDRQCGLKSSYEDFAEWLSQDDAKANDNFWSVYFLDKKLSGKLWSSFEFCLQEFVASYNNHSWLPLAWVSAAKQYSKSFSLHDGDSSAAAKVLKYLPGYVVESSAPNKVMSYMVNYIKSKGEDAISLDAFWFLDELMAFERQFAEFLRNEVSNNDNYILSARELMYQLTQREKVNVLSFNYTTPFKANAFIDRVDQVTNVHGTIDDDNIIFGVDATAKLPANAQIFTKTHRKMIQSAPTRALPWHCTEIKFYGHSLEKADYSYFQSIFDSYNLYGGSLAFGNGISEMVKLKFYFSIFDKSREAQIKRDATQRVYALISAYSETLDNKDKGKNLLHKLLLEGRVQIIFLPNIELQ